MEIENIKTLIRLGFEPSRYFKRSAWVKVERVMEFLVNKGEISKVNGEVKYVGERTEENITRWANMYMQSPFVEHTDEILRMSKELGLPLNSLELLNKFMDLKTK